MGEWVSADPGALVGGGDPSACEDRAAGGRKELVWTKAEVYKVGAGWRPGWYTALVKRRHGVIQSIDAGKRQGASAAPFQDPGQGERIEGRPMQELPRDRASDLDVV